MMRRPIPVVAGLSLTLTSGCGRLFDGFDFERTLVGEWHLRLVTTEYGTDEFPQHSYYGDCDYVNGTRLEVDGDYVAYWISYTTVTGCTNGYDGEYPYGPLMVDVVEAGVHYLIDFGGALVLDCHLMDPKLECEDLTNGAIFEFERG